MDKKPEQGLSPLKRALIAVKDMREKLEAAERAQKEPVAIVGMACRFPGAARDLEGYWDVLKNGIDAVGEVPPDRWDIDAYHDPDPETPGKMYMREGGFIKDIDQFDADFFGITPREAARMDPQQRLLLDASWQALESAGINPGSLTNSLTGVFVGISTNEYVQLGLKQNDPDWIDAYTGTGGAFSVAAGRISYFLGLNGPAVALDTACSSSLVAIDLAVNYLRAGRCRLALAGGVNLMLSPESSVYLCKVRALSPDGRCKTFDETGDGYGRGEGCGMLALKRMRDALADGDRVLAVIIGSATNHDGHSAGLTVPNGPAQKAVIQAALSDARIEPEQVSYIETHGTGTSLGDPIEIRALDSIFKNNPSLLIGTAKTNIGHLESAAGVAAVIKVVLALQNGMIPPNLHFNHPSTHIPWDTISMRVPTEATPWPEEVTAPIAGVSSFGFSGTNAHLILQSPPEMDRTASTIERPIHILPVSARSREALNQLTQRYATHLRRNEAQSVGDLCFTAGVGRTHFEKRIALLTSERKQLIEQLDACNRGEPGPGVFYGEPVSRERSPKIAFLFTGQGSQYQGMGRGLYESQPVFRKVLDECDELLRTHWNQSLIKLLYPDPGAESEASRYLNQTAYTQPALFAVEYALAQLWRSWGVEPTLVMGHSVGEYVAACISGVFSLEDGLKLISARSGLMQLLPAGGRMTAVFADASVVSKLISGYEKNVSIAAMNGPRNTVISGAGEDIDTLVQRLASRDVKTQDLQVSHAFHSPLMEPMLVEFEKIAAKIAYSSPQIKLISNLTGGVAEGKDISQADWWCRHVRAPVRFADSMRFLMEQKVDFYLEVGPSPVLLAMGQQCGSAEDTEWLPSLRRGRDDWSQMLESLAKLYVKGVDVDWTGFDRGYQRRKITLPSYAFQRESFWMKKTSPKLRAKSIPSSEEVAGVHPLLGRRLRSPLIEDVVYSTSISTDALPFLKDHVVFGSIVFPATAFLEMAIAAMKQQTLSSGVSLKGMTIEEPFILKASQHYTLQVILTSDGQEGSRFRIFSSEDNGQEWTLNASGIVRPDGGPLQPTVPVGNSLDNIRKRCDVKIGVESYYSKLSDMGIEYGPDFQTIEKLWHGQGQGLGQLRVGDEMAGHAKKYQVHPAMLDGCLQILGTALMMDAEQNDSRNLYLPIEFGKFTFYKEPGPSCWCHAQITNGSSGQAETIEADLCVWDEQGNPVATIEGLIAKSAEKEALQRICEKRIEEWLYQVQWQPATKPNAASHQNGGDGVRWLVFADRSGMADAMIAQWGQSGHKFTMVYPGEKYQIIDDRHVMIDPLDPGDFHRLLADIFATRQSRFAGVVHLWSLDNDPDPLAIESIERSERLICGSVLHLIQAMGKQSLSPSFKFWLVTRGAQSVDEHSITPQIFHNTFWGLGHVMALEHPELGCMRIDLDPRDGKASAGQLIREIQGAESEEQIAYRDGHRYVARLVRIASPPHSKESATLTLPRGESYRLVVHQRGIIDNIVLAETRREPPGPDEVEIRVHVTGLNFRDVLNVLDMYPGDAGELGSECVGRITAVGENVSGYKAGDKVIAMAAGSFSKYTVTPADLVMPIPSQLSDEEAATLPIVFLTAYYGLHHLAGMKKGDRVLIHAAAGGVGMAAVQLAKWAGAEVFGTAGSPEKQQFLKTIGVDHVMHSRTLDFASDIMEITGGNGVDIVLNALAGDFIAKSLSVLGPGGRFIEIGKADIWDRERIDRVNPGVEYEAFDLADVIMKDTQLVGVMFQHILEGFKAQQLRSLPFHNFPIENAIDAFRFMAQARHTGKIVITHPAKADAEGGRGSASIQAEAAYFITGGLGSLGLTLADWLVAQGARHIILMGRSDPGEKILESIESLRSRGAAVTIVKGDVTRPEDLERIFKIIEDLQKPLRGIIHAAGVLHDGVLMQQNWETFEKVLAPKVKGAWLLNEFSRKCPLDFFILFSSAAAVLGSPGQANYAAANAFMDGLAHYMNVQGRNAMSIDWGPWGQKGMADALSGQNRNRVAARGIEPILPEQGLQTMNLLLKRPLPQVTVLPMNWSKFFQAFPENQIPAIYAELAVEARPGKQSKPMDSQRSVLKQQLEAAPESDRQDMLISFVTSHAAKVMGVDASKVLDIKTPFNSLGLDSLMAVELRNAIAEAVGHSLPASLIYDYSTIEALAGFLSQELLIADMSESTSEDKKELDHPDESVADVIDGLSQEDMAQLLAEKIALLNQGKSE